MKHFFLKFIPCLLVIVIHCALPLRSSAEVSDPILATGNGFEITRSYVGAIEDFYKLQSFTTTLEQFLRMAVRTRVFALEAKDLGLDRIEVVVDIDRLNPDTVREYDQVMSFIRHLEYSEAYASYLRRNYKVPSDVIVSFYHANSERFREGPWSDDSLSPLTSEIEEQIRRIIINSVQKRLIDQAYKELTQKYGVIIND